MKRLMFQIAVLLAAAGPAMAADAMQLKSEVFQEVAAPGKKEKQLVPATKVAPGTEVVYVITYTNGGDQPAQKVNITNPVPADLEYVGAAGADVSVDGGRTYGALAKLTVPGADGKPRAAQAKDVTHVRWAIAQAVAPGAGGQVRYRARLK